MFSELISTQAFPASRPIYAFSRSIKEEEKPFQIKGIV